MRRTAIRKQRTIWLLLAVVSLERHRGSCEETILRHRRFRHRIETNNGSSRTSSLLTPRSNHIDTEDLQIRSIRKNTRRTKDSTLKGKSIKLSRDYTDDDDSVDENWRVDMGEIQTSTNDRSQDYIIEQVQDDVGESIGMGVYNRSFQHVKRCVGSI